jgi:D-glycero-D-manno-heptose 1,7-bisphosphate phosphatase
VEAGVTRRFVLLDRDGTINEEVGYVLDPAELRLLPGAARAVRTLMDLGLGLAVVTNQSPVGRGWITEEDLGRIHGRLAELLGEAGARLDAIEHCPHVPDVGCSCRKPATAMVDRLVARFGFDPAEAFVVGDHAVDMALGRAVGARTILLLSGHGTAERPAAEPFADRVVPDLGAAAAVIREEVLAGAEP